MMRFIRGDIFRQRVGAPVNPVNCRGVTGRGLALRFRSAYPECYPTHRQACLDGTRRPGSVLFSPTGHKMPQRVIHFPTKRGPRDKSLRHDIDEALRDLALAIPRRRIASIAVPPLGCGPGGLSWHDVRPLIEHRLRALSCDVIVLEPALPTPKTSPRNQNRAFPPQQACGAWMHGIDRPMSVPKPIRGYRRNSAHRRPGPSRRPVPPPRPPSCTAPPP